MEQSYSNVVTVNTEASLSSWFLFLYVTDEEHAPKGALKVTNCYCVLLHKAKF